jgi:uncharacterized protein (TIGR03067 family)
MRRASQVVAAFLLITLMAWAQDAKKEQEMLQGTWSVVAAEKDGAADESIKTDKLVIAGDKITVKKGSGGDEEPAPFTIDATKQPKRLDITAKGQTILAIYEIKGDELKLCFSRDERPTDFTTKAGSNRMLVTLKKDK